MTAQRNPLGLSTQIYIISTAVFLLISELAIGGGNNFTSLICTTIYSLLATISFAIPQVRKDISLNSWLTTTAVFFFVVVVICSFDIVSHFAGNRASTVDFSPPLSHGAIDSSRSLIEVVKLLGLACIFFVGFTIGKSNETFEFFLEIFLPLCLIYSVLAFCSFILQPNTTMWFVDKEIFKERLTASFLSPNTAGTFFGVYIILSSAYLFNNIGHLKPKARLDEKRLASITISVLYICVASTDLLLTASRAAIFLTSIAVLLFIAATRRPRNSAKSRSLWIFFILAVIFGAAISVSATTLFKRMASIQMEVAIRANTVLMHLSAIKEHPIEGYGLGNFSLIHKLLLTQSNYELTWDVQAMHNVYLQWIEAAGLPGALSMFACVLIPSIRPLMGRKIGGKSVLYSTALVLSLLIFAVHGLVDFAFEDYAMAGFASFILGNCLTAAYKAPYSHHEIHAD